MKLITVTILTLISVFLVFGKSTGDDDLATHVGRAKKRLQSDFISKLWYGASEAILSAQDKVLKLYTEYTIQQAHHVIEHISFHRNVTRLENADKRLKVLSTKQMPKLLSILQCMFTYEGNTMTAYKLSGYNLHNCIRSAQNQMEEKYLKIVRNLENIKNVSLTAFDHYDKSVENCVQISCVLSTLFKSIIHYEKLQEEVATNMTEVDNLSTRYIFSYVAIGCVSNSLSQVSENYKIGNDLVDECLLQIN